MSIIIEKLNIVMIFHILLTSFNYRIKEIFFIESDGCFYYILKLISKVLRIKLIKLKFKLMDVYDGD